MERDYIVLGNRYTYLAYFNPKVSKVSVQLIFIIITSDS
jgi:hypothetical protein